MILIRGTTAKLAQIGQQILERLTARLEPLDGQVPHWLQ